MVQGCPLLERVDIGAWNKAWAYHYEDDFDEDFVPDVSVTNAAMYAIAQFCPYLKVFHISSADPLAYDNSGLDAIKHGCPHLQAIYKDDKVYYAVHGYNTAEPIDEDYGDSDIASCIDSD